MPFQRPEEIGYGHVIERYVTKKDSERPRYLELGSGRVLRPGWPHAERFARHLIEDAATITDAELEALLAYEWRSRLTAAWLIGVGRRTLFLERIGDLLLASEVCYSGGGYCFALARLGTPADAEILTAYLDRYLPRTDLRYDQPAALGALVRLDAHLDTGHADRFTQPDGLGEQWVNALVHLQDHPGYTPEEQRRWLEMEENLWRGIGVPACRYNCLAWGLISAVLPVVGAGTRSPDLVPGVLGAGWGAVEVLAFYRGRAWFPAALLCRVGAGVRDVLTTAAA
ncbi:DUF6000 family protein [Streptomyces sp. NPDC099050]|uniref:DUF6000 family protein n=1 Tax=Streptomyces sp. NPDC099050 TaxID=3366100 RepID=UPI0038070801